MEAVPPKVSSSHGLEDTLKGIDEKLDGIE
jgi:hypothetical protein